MIDEAGKQLLNPTSAAAVLGAVCVALGYFCFKLWNETVRLNKIIFDVQRESAAAFQKSSIDFVREVVSWREMLAKFIDSIKG